MEQGSMMYTFLQCVAYMVIAGGTFGAIMAALDVYESGPLSEKKEE